MSDALTQVTLAANDMARTIEQLKAALSEYEQLSPQQCPKGVHADWLVDSEYAHACPWCQIDGLDLCADCGHVESAHSKDGETDCNASGARLCKCACSYFIPGGAA